MRDAENCVRILRDIYVILSTLKSMANHAQQFLFFRVSFCLFLICILLYIHANSCAYTAREFCIPKAHLLVECRSTRKEERERDTIVWTWLSQLYPDTLFPVVVSMRLRAFRLISRAFSLLLLYLLHAQARTIEHRVRLRGGVIYKLRA